MIFIITAFLKVKSVFICYPNGDKVTLNGNETAGAFTFLASRLRSTTVQKVTIGFREVKINNQNTEKVQGIKTNC